MKTSVDRSTKILYDRDYQLWLEETLKQLRSQEFDQVNWGNLLDELESMGKTINE